ncbi:MAG TPA: PIN domain-containing protein [Actinomycetota bacterium]|nr:PIN domain-containing protein [Actinomycetota bacterium]
MPVFVDTNVLVYARDSSEGTKHERANAWMRHLWETADARVSVQVLQEYYVTVTKKLRPGLSREAARADITDLAAWRPVESRHALLEGAWAIEDRFAISFWDALIVAAAHEAGCPHLLTEDLASGMDLDGVVVLDPFTTQPGAEAER